jgi:hypothetical protein
MRKPNAVRERKLVRVFVTLDTVKCSRQIFHGKKNRKQNKTEKQKKVKSREPHRIWGVDGGAAATQMAAGTHCQHESGTCRSF